MTKVSAAVLLVLSLMVTGLPLGAQTQRPGSAPQLVGLAPVAPARCLRWDYYDYPVKLTSSTTKEDYRTHFAMDGYPAKVSHSAPRDTHSTMAPTPDRPEVLTADYGKPVAATRFTHYYDQWRDTTAWKDVDILSSADGEHFKLIESFTNLTVQYPQVLSINNPSPARYYRFVIKSLAAGGKDLVTYEIGTYFGTSVGSVQAGVIVQSEPFVMKVRVTSLDIDLKGATLRFIAAKGSLVAQNTAVPTIHKGGSALVTIKATALASGPLPVTVELRAGGFRIDSSLHTFSAQPKLRLDVATPVATGPVSRGSEVKITGTVTNSGNSLSNGVSVSWAGAVAKLGKLAPGKSARFELKTIAKPGYTDGTIVASDSGLAREIVRHAIICPAGTEAVVGKSRFAAKDGRLAIAIPAVGGKRAVTGNLKLVVAGQPTPLVVTGRDTLAAAVPGGVLAGRIMQRKPTGDISLKWTVIPNDPNPVVAPWLDMQIQVAVDNPKIMFRPHVDWYTVEHGPNLPGLTNGHNCATRMICVQTKNSTLSVIPSTDNLAYGFDDKNAICVWLQIPMRRTDPLGRGVWRPVGEGPMQFDLLLTARSGDWWDAYRYVTQKVFKFTQPRQWAMPVTQMQMHNIRYLMSYPAWSEKWQSVHSFPYTDTFFNFYGTTYSLPALYSWYLATGNIDAKT
ncbi:MAG: hypothetical protein WCL39_05930, partial [Armatimonadota bacterium]